MKITYDRAADALAIQFTSGKGKRPRTMGVAPGVHLDFDADGHLVALELLDASVHIPKAELEQLDTAAEELTLVEAAKESGHEAGTLRVLANSGRLAARKKGRDWVVTRAALYTYLESRDVRGGKVTPPRKRRAPRAVLA
jgi:uncharacterized protein YuzE